MIAKCNLRSPNLPLGHKVYKILDAIQAPVNYVHRLYYWGANQYGLQNSRLYKSLSPADQERVLIKVSDRLLEEAYFIEKAGIAFAAKMILLAESTQEREMYSHFASQESRHLSLLRPFLKHDQYKPNEFLEMLVEMIETGDKACLTYVIQVLLEGFGLTHYKHLTAHCLEPTLVTTLNSILKDEAQHYRSGVALYDPKRLTEAQRAWVERAIAKFINYINHGPIRTLNSVLEVVGKIHVTTYRDLLDDISAKEQTNQAIAVFNGLRRD